MTHYQKLVRHAAQAMTRFPKGMIAMDATDFSILATGATPAALVNRIEKRRGKRGPTVILAKPRRAETWIL